MQFRTSFLVSLYGTSLLSSGGVALSSDGVLTELNDMQDANQVVTMDWHGLNDIKTYGSEPKETEAARFITIERSDSDGNAKNLRHRWRGANGLNNRTPKNDGRRLKGSKNSTPAPSISTAPSPTPGTSCTDLARYYTCDENKVAICYVHDDHYHNKCVDVDNDDILDKVPGFDLYKDKYELLNCGCCPEEHLHNNIVSEIKYPKSYKDDPYCDSITSAPSSVPTSTPSSAPSSAPSEGTCGGTNVWTQIGTDIDGEAADDLSGYSVSLSSDGQTVAIGAKDNHGTGSDSGHTRIYQWNGSAWIQLGNDIDGEAVDDESGFSVSLSSDGETVAIGARNNDANGSNSGHARVYQWDGSAWTQLGNDVDGEATDDWSGYSVSLSDDGETIAIGAIRNDGNGSNSGHVRLYSLECLIA